MEAAAEAEEEEQQVALAEMEAETEEAMVEAMVVEAYVRPRTRAMAEAETVVARAMAEAEQVERRTETRKKRTKVAVQRELVRKLTGKRPAPESHASSSSADLRQNTRSSNSLYSAQIRDIEDVRRSNPRTLVQRRNLLPTPSSTAVTLVLRLRPGLVGVHVLRARSPTASTAKAQRIGGLEVPRTLHRSDLFFWATPSQLGIESYNEWDATEAGVVDASYDGAVARGAQLMNEHLPCQCSRFVCAMPLMLLFRSHTQACALTCTGLSQQWYTLRAVLLIGRRPWTLR